MNLTPSTLARASLSNPKLPHPHHLVGLSGAYDGAMATVGPWGFWRWDTLRTLPRLVTEGRIHPSYPGAPWLSIGEAAWATQAPTSLWRMPFAAQRMLSIPPGSPPDGWYGSTYELDLSDAPLIDGRASLFFLVTETNPAPRFRVLVEGVNAAGVVVASAALNDDNAALERILWALFAGNDGRSPSAAAVASVSAAGGDNSYLGWLTLSRGLVAGNIAAEGSGIVLGSVANTDPIHKLRVSVLVRIDAGVWSQAPSQLGLLALRVTRSVANLANAANTFASGTDSGSIANLFDGSTSTFWNDAPVGSAAYGGVVFLATRFASPTRVTSIGWRNYTTTSNQHPSLVDVLIRVEQDGPLLHLGRHYANTTLASGAIAGWSFVELPFGVPMCHEVHLRPAAGLGSGNPWRVTEFRVQGDPTPVQALEGPLPAGLSPTRGAWVLDGAGAAASPLGGDGSAGQLLRGLEVALGMQADGQLARLRVGDFGMWGSAELVWGSVSNGATATATIPVQGAQPGDLVAVTPPPALQARIAVTKALVTAPDTVQVTVTNFTGGSITPATGRWVARALKGGT